MLSYWIVWVLIGLTADFSLQKSDFDSTEFIKLIYNKRGNVSIVVVNDRFGNECDQDSERGLEEIASAIWTVEALNKYQYLAGATIGLSVFGICQNVNKQHGLLERVEERLRVNGTEDYIGILTTPTVHKILTTSESSRSRNILQIEHVLSFEMLNHATVQLLINLQWMKVNAVISDSSNTLGSFREKASEESIFISEELLMNTRDFFKKLTSSKKITGVVVVIADFANITTLIEKLHDYNINLILTPTDFVFDFNLSGLPGLPKNTIVSLPSTAHKTTLSRWTKNTLQRGDFYSRRPPVRGPLFIGMASSILKLLKPIRKVFNESCQNGDFYSEKPCAPIADFIIAAHSNKTVLLSQKSMKISPDDVEETLKVLQIEPSSNDEMFLYITSVINANSSEDLAFFQIFNLKTKMFLPVLIKIDDSALTRSAKMNHSEKQIEFSNQTSEFDPVKTEKLSFIRDPIIGYLANSTTENVQLLSEQSENFTSSKNSVKKLCDSQDVKNYVCSNRAMNLTAVAQINDTGENNSSVAWRSLTWVSINTSFAVVGVTCTVSTMIFIITRLCRDDIPSSPYFTLSLMVSVLFMYISSLPFHFEFFPDNEFMCSYRKYGPSIVFSVLFSLLLSRSFALAFNESRDDFVSHVNGYLQSILCFFMIGVQMALISQNWILEQNGLNCADIYDKYKMIFPFAYNFFLIILLACVSPFIIRSKQNNKEGLLFSISVFFITVVWSAWISFYVLLPNEHKDAAVAFGLNSTASVLLLCIFIPQTYFIAAPFDQERTLRPFSSLNRNFLGDVSNINFKSNQALNESAFGTVTYKNCEMGLSNPNFSTSRSREDCNLTRVDDFIRETVIDVSPEVAQTD